MKPSYIFLYFLIIYNFLSSQDVNAPTNLEVDLATIGGVQLSWDHPPIFSREWITHSNENFLSGNPAMGLGYSGYGHFAGQKFTAEMLRDYHGMLIEKMAFVVTSDTGSFRTHIFATEIGSLPDFTWKTDMILTSSLVSPGSENLTPNDWNYVDLTNFETGTAWEDMIEPSTFTIDSTKDLWFGYWMYYYTGNPSGLDNGPANNGYGNVQVWCWDIDSCAEVTTIQNGNINRNYLVALQLKPTDESNDVDRYFILENGDVVGYEFPAYMNVGYSGREKTNLGPRAEGTYTYAVRSLTNDGLSDLSNAVTVEIINNVPGPFDMIAPEDGTIISFNQATISNNINFIWSNSLDPDGYDLSYTFTICNETSDISLCYDTTMTDRLFQVSAQELVDSLSLQSGDNPLIWSVFVSDGIDSVFANDSMRVVTLSLDLLSTISVSTIPISFNLQQNYPNPFNPVTSLRYDLPEDGLVNITIYDMMGRIVKTLVNSSQTAGFKSVQWNATNDRNESISAGLYLYTIQAGEFRQTKKMVLLK